MTSFAFDVTSAPDLAPAPSKYGPIPAGDYKAMITDSEMKPTRAGTGQYLQLVWEITEGQHTDRKIWDRLNLVNPNPTAVDIAKRDLASIMRAVGLDKIDDTEQLHYKEVMITVTVRKGDNGYEDSNEIKAYAPAGRSAPAAPAAVATPAAAPASVPGKKPWE
ncbi:MAG: DUF669 domain-containing protein [Burkholderiaceae bacterium]